MICVVCGTLREDCDCEGDEELDIDFGDTEWVWGYDGDAL